MTTTGTLGGTTLATVTEAEADEATATIFADIRETMGVALVNLIWRHLAVSPAALSWSWRSLKPLYASGAVPRAAWALRQSLAWPELGAFNERDRRALGSAIDDLTLIDAVLRTYERGNAQNLIALCALRSALRQRATGAKSDDHGNSHRHGNSDSERVRVPATTTPADQIQAERADRVTEALPPLPAMRELHAEIRSDIEALAQIWVPAQHRGMIPSVFRHLAHWPALLRIYRARFQALPRAQAAVTELADEAVHQATRQAIALVGQLGTPAAADGRTREWLGSALDLFIDGMIGRGVVLVPAMRKVLPGR